MISVNFINQFVFSRPEVRELFGHANFFDAPVYPVNEQPESASPYTIYTWRTSPSRDLYAFQLDTITYSIWDHDIYRLQRYESILKKYMSRRDESAQAFMDWAIFNQIEGVSVIVHDITYLGSTDVFPEEEEGGVVGKNMTFQVKYIDCEVYGDSDRLDTSA